jgi:cation diffusion facilitator family transporter
MILCGAMMVLEIAGGWLFGSIALIADGLHMSTHAGAMLLAAMAYSYARRHANDQRFTFGTGKLGDLAGFTSAIILGLIAVLIGYEAIARFIAPVAISFREAIPIAFLGLLVNIASAWLLSEGGVHHHDHHRTGAAHQEHRIRAQSGTWVLSLFEADERAFFRLQTEDFARLPGNASVEIVHSVGGSHFFSMADRGGFLESTQPVPEPHGFTACLRADGQEHMLAFAEQEGAHGHGSAHRDNNMRAAVVHVIADAAVSVLVIVGLTLARFLGWLWMDPLAGIIGAGVIASWSYGLIRDTGAILLDMNPDEGVTRALRKVIEAEGDSVSDLHVWRLGPGHLAAVVSIKTDKPRDSRFYRERLSRFRSVSHLTVEVDRA